MNYQKLKKLTEVHAVTGDTALKRNYLKTELDNLNIKYKELGNGTIVFGKLENPKKMISAHIDEVGFQITKVETDGRIRILPIGWVFANRLDHANVYIQTKDKQIEGLILHEEELKAENILDFHSLYIDIGADSDKEAKELGIVAGQTGSFYKIYNENSNVIFSASLDNNVSVFTLLNVVEKNKNFLNENAFAFVTDEEMQDHSANGLCHNIKADTVIVLDYCPIHQKPGNGDVIGTTRNGSFVMYRGGSYIIHEELREYFETKIKTKFQKVFLSSNTVPVLEPSNFEDNGHTKAVNLCIPARGYHGSTYMVRKKDLENFEKIITEILNTEI